MKKISLSLQMGMHPRAAASPSETVVRSLEAALLGHLVTQGAPLMRFYVKRRPY